MVMANLLLVDGYVTGVPLFVVEVKRSELGVAGEHYVVACRIELVGGY